MFLVSSDNFMSEISGMFISKYEFFIFHTLS